MLKAQSVSVFTPQSVSHTPLERCAILGHHFTPCFVCHHVHIYIYICEYALLYSTSAPFQQYDSPVADSTTTLCTLPLPAFLSIKPLAASCRRLTQFYKARIPRRMASSSSSSRLELHHQVQGQLRSRSSTRTDSSRPSLLTPQKGKAPSFSDAVVIFFGLDWVVLDWIGLDWIVGTYGIMYNMYRECCVYKGGVNIYFRDALTLCAV